MELDEMIGNNICVSPTLLILVLKVFLIMQVCVNLCAFMWKIVHVYWFCILKERCVSFVLDTISRISFATQNNLLMVFYELLLCHDSDVDLLILRFHV